MASIVLVDHSVRNASFKQVVDLIAEDKFDEASAIIATQDKMFQNTCLYEIAKKHIKRGDYARALEEAEKCHSPQRLEFDPKALIEDQIFNKLVEKGDFSEAKKISGKWSLATVVYRVQFLYDKFLHAKSYDNAFESALMMGSSSTGLWALKELAKALEREKDILGACRVLKEIKEERERSDALQYMLERLLHFNDLPNAFRVLNEIPEAYQSHVKDLKARYLKKVAEANARATDS